MGSIKFIIDTSFEAFCEDIAPFLLPNIGEHNMDKFYRMGAVLFLQENLNDCFREEFVKTMGGKVWTYEAHNISDMVAKLQRKWDEREGTTLVITDISQPNQWNIQCDVAFVSSDLFPALRRTEKVSKVVHGKSYMIYTNLALSKNLKPYNTAC